MKEQLLRLTAQRPIRFTHVLLGGELDPGGIEFLPGMVNDAESVRRTQEFQWSHQLAVPVYEQIQVLKVEPGRAPEKITMSNTLEALQAAVGGDIEAVGLDTDAYLVCNELGKLTGLPANRRVHGETIAGIFLIVGSSDGDFCSLSDGDAAYYDRELSEPMPSYGEPDQPSQWEFRVL